jgi:small subunit ribosomal protein S3
MGHKVNPTSIRLQITDTWKSKWFSANNYANFLREDVQIRDFLEKHLRRAGLVRIEIERSNAGTLSITIKTTKPGMIIGKGGAGIEELKKKLISKLRLKTEVRINIEEVRDLNLQAQVIASQIAEQIEKRVAFRKLMKQSLEQVMNGGARGVKVAIGGRLNGAEIARTEHLSSGKIPLHTLRADVDFARATAYTTYGTIGIKVWIYRGDVQRKRVEGKVVPQQA